MGLSATVPPDVLDVYRHGDAFACRNSTLYLALRYLKNRLCFVRLGRENDGYVELFGCLTASAAAACGVVELKAYIDALLGICDIAEYLYRNVEGGLAACGRLS